MSFNIDELSRKMSRRGATKLGALGAAAAFGAIPLVGKAQDEERKRRPGKDEGGESRVYRGTDIPDGKYPWLMAQVGRSGSTFTRSAGCTATYIGSKKVLTAAHCVRLETPAGLGYASSDTDLAETPTFTGVSTIAVHPLYPTDGSHNPKYDVAVVTLESTPFPLISPIPLIAENRQDLYPAGTTVRIMGWGHFDGSGPATDEYVQAREAKIVLYSDQACKDAHGGNFPVNYLMCGMGTNKEGARSGDSGGPAVLPRGADSTLYQIGVCSNLVNEVDGDIITTYTEVANSDIRAFIRQHAGSAV